MCYEVLSLIIEGYIVFIIVKEFFFQVKRASIMIENLLNLLSFLVYYFII
jgi:hypothetical protein